MALIKDICSKFLLDHNDTFDIFSVKCKFTPNYESNTTIPDA